MLTYYDRKKGCFVQQKTPTSCPARKILINAARLEGLRRGTYGEAPGQYYSTINGVDFLWDDLREILVFPHWDIKVYSPSGLDSDFVLIDR